MSMLRHIVDMIINPEEHKGIGGKGERLTYLELTGLFSGLFVKEQVLRNVYIKKNDGKFTEIDLVVVSRKGIFVIESKNLSGWIYGSENKEKWVQTLPNGMKYRFYNPIWQNKGHVKAISEFLEECGYGKFIKFYSLIVFSERCELKNIDVVSDDVHVIKRDGLNGCINKILKNNKDCLTKAIRDDIIQTLGRLSRPDEEIREQHLSDVEEVMESKANSCPRCRSELKERVNKTTGEAFWGCGGFPKCRYAVKEKS